MNKPTFIAILLLSALSLMPSVAHAQWRAGASGGATYNLYSINTHYQADYHFVGAWGWNAAVFGQYDFYEWLGLRAELEASERNYRLYRTGIWAGVNYTTRNTYLLMPVMTQFSFGGSHVRGFVNTGVYGGYWLTGRYNGYTADMVNGKTVKVDEPYLFRQDKDQRWDFGLAGGIGIEYCFLNHWAVHAEGRCYYSFISATNQYMRIKDYRYNTTFGINAGFAYLF